MAEDIVDLREHFSGGFATEDAALAAFDEIIEASGYFRLYREVEGYYMASRPGRTHATARIDRLLVPNQRARAAGWTLTFGVEAKRSGAPIGPAVSQAIDYTWCVFRASSTFLYPEWIFLWPLGRQTGAIESVMAQNRIGIAQPNERHQSITFAQSASVLLEVARSGEFRHRADLAVRTGLKKGSR